MIQLQARHATSSQNIVTALRPWRRRLLLQQATRWTACGLVAGLIVACLVLLVSHLIPWAGAIYWAAGLALFCVLFTLGFALWYRPTFAITARRVDKQLKLHDRLSTAWELRDEVSTLATLQRRDALKQLGTYTPKTALSLRPTRSLLIMFGVTLLALVALFILPNPMDAVLKQQAAFQKTVATQIKHIEQTRQQLVHQPGVTPEQKKQIDKILSDLESKLQQAKSSNQAQQALAEAQAKLNQLRNPDAANRLQGHNAASSALQGSNNRTLNAVGQALSKNDLKQLANSLKSLKQLANSLKSLSSQISKLSPSQRSQLAQQLEQAANQASQNPQLSSALHQLAKSVANGSQSDVSDAVNAVEQAAQQDANDATQNSAVSQAQNSVQQAANNLAIANDGTSSQGQAQAQGQGQGQQNQAQQGQVQGQGQQVQGQGQGDSQTPGQAHGQGQGQGQGNAQGNGSGQGGSGKGGSGGGNAAGNNQGKQEQVTIPGQIGSGASVQNQDPGNNGVVQGGSSIPYSQVVEEYAQAAHDAIDNSGIPSNEKDLVGGYFNSLEGQ